MPAPGCSLAAAGERRPTRKGPFQLLRTSPGPRGAENSAKTPAPYHDTSQFWSHPCSFLTVPFRLCLACAPSGPGPPNLGSLGPSFLLPLLLSLTFSWPHPSPGTAPSPWCRRPGALLGTRIREMSLPAPASLACTMKLNATAAPPRPP